jgi:hypothetical protein
MKKPKRGTERPRGFVVEIGPSWRRWAKPRTQAELEEIESRLKQLLEIFGEPHVHTGLGVRRLTPGFAFIKPRTFQLAMTGTHDEVRRWLKANV